MIQTLSYAPGQQATVFLEVKDGYGQRSDGYGDIPFVSRIIFPGFTLAACYPQNMIRLDVGLFYFQFFLPTGAVSVGSYLVDVSYFDVALSYPTTKLYQILVSAPFGNYGVTATVGM